MERAALRTEIISGVTGMCCYFSKTISDMQDISRCKRQLIPPIFVYLSQVSARGMSFGSNVLTGLLHCSAKAMTYVLGVAETDWAFLH